MATPIEMPKLGNTVEECLIARWYKQEGDTVLEGDILAEIETDKATFELTAPVGGTLLGAFFKNGDLVPVFVNVCVVGAPGESIEEFRPQITAGPSSAKPQSAAAPIRREPIQTARAAAAPIAASLSPRARRFAEEHNFPPRTSLEPVLEEEFSKRI